MDINDIKRQELAKAGYVICDSANTFYNGVTGLVARNKKNKVAICFLYIDGKADNGECMVDRNTLTKIESSFQETEKPILLITDMGVELSKMEISKKEKGIGLSGCFGKPIKLFVEDLYNEYGEDKEKKNKVRKDRKEEEIGY